MATDLPELPWVLLRKDKPRIDEASLDRAKRFYDQLRFNGNKQPPAVIFGPGGEAWYASGLSQWIRDDDRRKREAVAEPAEPESAK